MNKICNRLFFTLIVFLLPFSLPALGVLTHEAIIDASWDKSIVPLLKAKYPAATDSMLREAHAYAYGGAVAPDMGYYPFGSKLFTNLVHYVRSGDMVIALLKDANNINEYAFALGFLSHYNADNYGHPLATNISVPLVYPKMGRRYGSKITYAQNRISHMRMEFGFDVLEVAKGNYASQSYRDFIGFKVDTSVLSRAFFETYGLTINEVSGNHFQLAVETFRWIVANVFPVLTRSAWASKKHHITEQDHTAAAKNFTYRMHQRQYNKQFGKGYKRPGFGATILSFFIRVLPKVGPTRALRFKAPTPLAEKYFEKSFDTIIKSYSRNLDQLKDGNLSLKDMDFDTGMPTASGEYKLADHTYNEWLLKLKKDNFKNLTYQQKQNILTFFLFTDISKKKLDHSKRSEKFFLAYNGLNVTEPTR
ncbi:MAG: zinc dependent phospholipase C family protein [Ginsengibacter sp.]